jgi:hypothetical protein
MLMVREGNLEQSIWGGGSLIGLGLLVVLIAPGQVKAIDV